MVCGNVAGTNTFDSQVSDSARYAVPYGKYLIVYLIAALIHLTAANYCPIKTMDSATSCFSRRG